MVSGVLLQSCKLAASLYVLVSLADGIVDINLATGLSESIPSFWVCFFETFTCRKVRIPEWKVRGTDRRWWQIIQRCAYYYIWWCRLPGCCKAGSGRSSVESAGHASSQAPLTGFNCGRLENQQEKDAWEGNQSFCRGMYHCVSHFFVCRLWWL